MFKSWGVRNVAPRTTAQKAAFDDLGVMLDVLLYTISKLCEIDDYVASFGIEVDQGGT